MKRCSASLIIGKMPIKITMRHHLIPIKRVTMKINKITRVGKMWRN